MAIKPLMAKVLQNEFVIVSDSKMGNGRSPQVDSMVSSLPTGVDGISLSSVKHKRPTSLVGLYLYIMVRNIKMGLMLMRTNQ